MIKFLLPILISQFTISAVATALQEKIWVEQREYGHASLRWSFRLYWANSRLLIFVLEIESYFCIRYIQSTTL